MSCLFHSLGQSAKAMGKFRQHCSYLEQDQVQDLEDYQRHAAEAKNAWDPVGLDQLGSSEHALNRPKVFGQNLAYCAKAQALRTGNLSLGG